jgi:hypothetical protein
VEATESGTRVTALGEEISGVRDQLDGLVAELDRRRHALSDWTRRRPARKAGGVALALAVMAAAWMLAPRLTARYWPRRSRRG